MKKITVRVTGSCFPVPVDVEAYQTSIPGLAVMHPPFSDGTPNTRYWNVTHIISGMQCGRLWSYRADAVAFAERIGPLLDWIQHERLLNPLLTAELRHTIQAIQDKLIGE